MYYGGYKVHDGLTINYKKYIKTITKRQIKILGTQKNEEKHRSTQKIHVINHMKYWTLTQCNVIIQFNLNK